MPDAKDIALSRARDLLACVTFDSNGIMVGGIRVGGNGGLVSIETLKAADQLQLALDAADQDQAVK